MTADRGQIALDFAIGASLFLLALVFASIFIPTLISPFVAGGSQANDIAAERIASNLAWQLQSTSDEGTQRLSGSCTDKFFSGSDLTNDCNGGNGTAWDEALTNSSNARVNVTLREPDDGTIKKSIGPDASGISGSGYASRPVKMFASGDRRILTVEVY